MIEEIKEIIENAKEVLLFLKNHKTACVISLIVIYIFCVLPMRGCSSYAYKYNELSSSYDELSSSYKNIEEDLNAMLYKYNNLLEQVSETVTEPTTEAASETTTVTITETTTEAQTHVATENTTSSAKTNSKAEGLAKYNFITYILDAQGFDYVVSDKASSFIKNNESLFPADNFENIKNLVDTNIEFKHLQKNISNYGDTFIKYEHGYVVSIKEYSSDYNVSIVQISNVYDGAFYYCIYFGSIDDVYDGDYITIYGLPVATANFTNVSNTTTQAVVLAAGYIVKE